MPVEADFVTDAAPNVFDDVEVAAAVPKAFVAGAPNAEPAGAVPKAGAGAPKGLLEGGAGAAAPPPKENEGLGGSVAAFPKANGVL